MTRAKRTKLQQIWQSQGTVGFPTRLCKRKSRSPRLGLTTSSIFEEDSSIESTVLGADTLLSWASSRSGRSSRSGLTVGSGKSVGTRKTLWSRFSSRSVLSRLSRGSGRSRWSLVSGFSGLSRGEGFGLSGDSGFSRGSLRSSLSRGSGRSTRSRGSRGSIGSGSAVGSSRSWVSGRSWGSGWAGRSCNEKQVRTSRFKKLNTLWARLAWRRSGGFARSCWGLSGGSGLSGGTGLSGTTVLSGGSLRSGETGKAASFALEVGSGVDGVVSGLTSSTVGRDVRSGLHVVDFDVDILSGSLAEADLVVHLTTHMVHVVVDHGEGDENRKNCHNREGNCRVGNEFVGLQTAVLLHHLELEWMQKES